MQTNQARRNRHRQTSRGIALFMASLSFLHAVATHAGTASRASELGREFHEVSQNVSPAVVSIASVRIIERDVPGPLRRFFEEHMPESFEFPQPEGEFRQPGLGSGVLISADGYILTNSHVVKDAEQLTVTLQDEREFEAQLVGIDQPTDLAVLKIEGRNLPVAEMGDSDTLKTGAFVIAIGSPFGLAHSITIGNVSAKGRANVGIAEYEDFIQTDAAINPGNSGGPLVDMSGKVVGINTAIFTRTGGAMGIGFAVPSNMAQAVMEQILERGYVVRGWLGVSIQDLTPLLAEAIDAEVDEGALIAGIMPETPAEAAGLERGDIVTEINGKRIEDGRGLRDHVAQIEPGTEVTVGLVRDGEVHEVDLVVGERPREEDPATPEPEPAEALGLRVSELTEPLRQRFNIQVEDGVLITAVARGSIAHENNLRPGMVIKEVNRQSVATMQDFQHAIRDAQDLGRVLFLVSFRGHTRYVVMPFGQD